MVRVVTARLGRSSELETSAHICGGVIPCRIDHKSLAQTQDMCDTAAAHNPRYPTGTAAALLYLPKVIRLLRKPSRRDVDRAAYQRELRLGS
jgi:hypothetical protein